MLWSDRFHQVLQRVWNIRGTALQVTILRMGLQVKDGGVLVDNRRLSGVGEERRTTLRLSARLSSFDKEYAARS